MGMGGTNITLERSWNIGFLEVREYDFKAIPTEYFALPDIIKRLDIGLGDDVQMVGGFVHHEGKKRNRPPVRSGIISLMPDSLSTLRPESWPMHTTGQHLR